MDMSVAPLMDQRKVEDCPASTLEGSAVKLLITSATGAGGAMAVGVGGGGGGGGGTFFLQPTANNTSADNRTSMPALDGCIDACNLELSLILTISSFFLDRSIVLLYSKQVFRCFLAWSTAGRRRRWPARYKSGFFPRVSMRTPDGRHREPSSDFHFVPRHG